MKILVNTYFDIKKVTIATPKNIYNSHLETIIVFHPGIKLLASKIIKGKTIANKIEIIYLKNQ